MGREEQRRQTRDAIVVAAVTVFSERGFHGASTRDIASAAGLTQGLLTYHFETKDQLWKAAADRIFCQLRAEVLAQSPLAAETDRRQSARQAIVRYVRFTATHPELLRFMVDEGRVDDERMRWLVREHLTPLFDAVQAISTELPPVGTKRRRDTDAAHLYYVLAGAGSLVFAIAPECLALTGVDPASDAVIERHAQFVAALLVP